MSKYCCRVVYTVSSTMRFLFTKNSLTQLLKECQPLSSRIPVTQSIIQCKVGVHCAAIFCRKYRYREYRYLITWIWL